MSISPAGVEVNIERVDERDAPEVVAPRPRPEASHIEGVFQPRLQNAEELPEGVAKDIFCVLHKRALNDDFKRWCGERGD